MFYLDQSLIQISSGLFKNSLLVIDHFVRKEILIEEILRRFIIATSETDYSVNLENLKGIVAATRSQTEFIFRRLQTLSAVHVDFFDQQQVSHLPFLSGGLTNPPADSVATLDQREMQDNIQCQHKGNQWCEIYASISEY